MPRLQNITKKNKVKVIKDTIKFLVNFKTIISLTYQYYLFMSRLHNSANYNDAE